VRSKGKRTRHKSRTSGVIPFVGVVDREIIAFSQGDTRRGSYNASLDISHPEIREFLNIRKPGNGDLHRKCLNLHHCVNIPDSFMEIIDRCMYDSNASDDWPLIDPHDGQVTEVVSAKELWEIIIKNRLATGEPYIHFIDSSNRALPPTMKAKGLKVRQANLCVEITLPTDEKRTAVCCLSSLNAFTYDQWKDDTLFIEDMMRMLDNTLQTFINKSKELPGDPLRRARYSAEMSRDVGLGLMGFHSYLQSKNIPIDSAIAKGINFKMFQSLASKTNAASLLLGSERGEPEDMKGTGHRFGHKMAIAPNATSSIICGGVSPACETIPANIFTHKTKTGSFEVKNSLLETLLASKGKNTGEVWSFAVHG
jgi:ribonucleoside-diphosphate reductase alpha chain